MGVGQVGYIVSTGPTLVSSLGPNLQVGLGRVLLLTVLASMRLTPAMWVVAVLSVLCLLLLERRILLQNDSIDSTAQCILSSWRDGVDNLRRSNRMLLPGL